MSGLERVIAVTGASGYIAGHIVKGLLERGYRVKGTVRSLADKDKYEHLLGLKNAENLQLVEADNEKEGGYDKAFEGCDAVIHTASPFFHPTKDQTEDYLYKALVVPAVNGTLNCMRAVLLNKIKKIVLTSSVAAIWGSQREKNPTHVYTEQDWNDVSRYGYSYSKTYAEKAAWDFVKEHPEIKLVTINPSFNLGPVLSTRSCESVEWIRMFFNKATVTTGMVKNSVNGVYGGILSFVDVRNVAQAHISALENENASGRYIIAQTEQHNFSEAAKIIHDAFPQYNVPTNLVEGEVEKTPLSVANDHSKAEKELGIEFIPFQKSIIDMVNSMITSGML